MADPTKTTPKLPANEEAIPNTPAVERLLAMMIEQRADDQQIQREQLKQTRQRSNVRGPDASHYNPQGQKDFPMPVLKCEVLMPWPMRASDTNGGLTWEEVELMNLIEPGEYTVSLLDGTEVVANVLGTRNKASRKIERLAFMGEYDPESHQYSTLYTKELRNAFPSIVATLKEILDQKGTDYSTVLSIKERHRRVKLPEGHADRLPVSVGE